MLNHIDKVMINDLNQATRESECIRNCLREAFAGYIMGDYNIMKSRIADAQRSVEKLDKLRDRKKKDDQLMADLRLAGKFLTREMIAEYEKQMGRAYK